MPVEDPLLFNVEWFDQSAGMNRDFVLSFYDSDNSVEMYDIKLKRLFLRRCHVATVHRKDLYVGNTIVVFSRHLVIKDYAHDKTKSRVEDKKQSTLVLIYPEAHSKVGHIIDCLERGGYTLGRVRTVRFTVTSANEFYDKFRVERKTDITEEVQMLANHDLPATAVEIIGPSAIKKWRFCLRPSVQFEGAAEQQEESLDSQQLSFDGVHGSHSLADAEFELSFIFDLHRFKVPAEPPVHESFGNPITCCLIKPHTLRESNAGQIIREIQDAGFYLFGLQSFVLDKKETEDFFEIYKGIPNQDYAGMVKQCSTGRCLVLALCKGSNLNLTKETPNVVEALRKLCGPSNPEVCRALYPDSLRARFGGLTQEENGIHCTDLDEDGPLEVEYFFSLLQPYRPQF